MTTTSPSPAGRPVLGVPEMPARGYRPEDTCRDPEDTGRGPVAFTSGHHFALSGHGAPSVLAEAVAAPLSVIVQVTKRCDFSCAFCSETLQMPTPR